MTPQEIETAVKRLEKEISTIKDIQAKRTKEQLVYPVDFNTQGVIQKVVLNYLTNFIFTNPIIFGSSLIGIYFGTGAPATSAPKGSLYLRTDGSGTTDRAYINTNGSTTWTAITTVA